jgi:hypothetical protein
MLYLHKNIPLPPGVHKQVQAIELRGRCVLQQTELIPIDHSRRIFFSYDSDCVGLIKPGEVKEA